jgi:hypothetical protein
MRRNTDIPLVFELLEIVRGESELGFEDAFRGEVSCRAT